MTPTAAPGRGEAPGAGTPPESALWRSFRATASAQLGAGIFAAFCLMALLAPLIAPQNPYDLSQLNLMDAFKPPAFLVGGMAGHLLGTDEQGRDLLSAMLYGCLLYTSPSPRDS